MSLLVDPPFALGQTLGVSSASDGTGWVGTVKQFPDVDPTTGQVRSNRIKTCVAVRNSSGTTLYGKRLVQFVSGSFSAVDQYTRTTNARAAGVTDEHLSAAGVASNDVFWVTVDGPTELTVDEAVAVGDLLAANTVAGAGATNAATGGKAVTATAAEAAAALGLVGYAVSSTDAADEDALVFVKIGS
jgi:hypothetical protein